MEWLSSSGSRDAQRLGFYWDRRGKSIRLLGSLGMGLGKAKVERRILFPGVDRIAYSTQYDHDFSGQLLAEYSLEAAGWAARPAAGLEYAYLGSSGFNESGAGSLDLGVQKRVAQVLRGSLELALSRELTLGAGWTMRPDCRFGWSHGTRMDGRGITATMADRTDKFSVRGRKGPADSFLLGLGLSVSKDAFLAYALYGGETGGGSDAHTAKGGVKFKF